MEVTGTLTPDSWVPILHWVSIFPDKDSAEENIKSPKIVPKAYEVLARSLVMGKNIMHIYVIMPTGVHRGREGPEKTISFSSSPFWR